LVSDIPAGDGNIEKLFLRCSTLATIGTTVSAETDSISRDAGNSRNSRNGRDGCISNSYRVAAPKINNSKDAGTILATAGTPSICSRRNSRDATTAGTPGMPTAAKT
jgi:hypothetical protein